MIVSYDLLYELEAVLLRGKFRSRLAVSDVLEYVLWIREGSTLARVPTGASVEVSRDPDDDYLYALALAQGAAYLVSGDPHLLELQRGPMRVVTPREFVEAVGPRR